jgi:hypothetical protein
MAKIRPETKESVVSELCDQLMGLFNKYPEQRTHLITHHGVMPIIDMFEARSSASIPGKGTHIPLYTPTHTHTLPHTPL